MEMTAEQRIEDIDVLVIGGGLAGVYAAIKAKESGAGKVVQVDKGKVLPSFIPIVGTHL